MRLVRALPFLLLLAGGALIAYSVASGSAALFLVVVIPVVTGGSAAFLVGVVLLFAGVLTLPLAWSDGSAPPEEEGPTAPGPRAPSAPRTRSGGLVLIGPVPIFFGGMRPASRRSYWLAVLAGLVLTLVVLGLFLVR